MRGAVFASAIKSDFQFAGHLAAFPRAVAEAAERNAAHRGATEHVVGHAAALLHFELPDRM